MIAGLVKLVAVAVAAGAADAGSCDDPRPVRVTVVAVLAHGRAAKVDPKLAELAKEVQKREPELTAFRAAACAQTSIAVGKGHTFDLPDKQAITVTVDKPKDRTGRVCLTIRPPGLGEITYVCRCEKFFPVVTPHTTPAGERLIVVVMAKPCTMK